MFHTTHNHQTRQLSFFGFVVNMGWAFQKRSAHRGYRSGFSCAFKRSYAL